MNNKSNENQSNGKIMVKKTLAIFLPIFGLMISYAIINLFISNRSEMDSIKNQEWHIVNIQSSTLDNDIIQAASDLLLLANNTDIRYNWNEDGQIASNALNKIENQFLSIAMHKDLYDQIRLLDKTGMELCRINYNNGKPIIVPQNKLQNKGNRYYFKDAFLLKRDEVFVSPLDLNVEHGKVEIPYKPMLRFGSPVFDTKGNKQGIVLINYLGSNLINRYTYQIDQANNSQSMLLNNNGYWIYTPHKEKSWGFMFEDKQNCSFSKEFPNAWNIIKSTDSCQFITKFGLFTARTVYPLLKGQKSSSGSGQAFSPSISQVNTKEYYWKILSYIPSKDLYKMKNSRILSTSMILFFLTSILLLGSTKISITTFRRKQVEEKREKLIVELNDALDQVKTLRGIVPICAGCKKIRNDEGYWEQVEVYIGDHTDAQFTHGLCEDCIKKYYPDVVDPDNSKQQ